MAHNTPYTTPMMGDPKTVEPGNPAAGANFGVTVPAGENWQILSVAAKLVADANIANRNVILRLTTAGGRPMGYTTWGFAQTAGLTIRYLFQLQGQTLTVPTDARVFYPLPVLWCPPSSLFEIAVIGIQVGDQFSEIVYQYQHWQPLT
jgi:hypothetical protein